ARAAPGRHCCREREPARTTPLPLSEASRRSPASRAAPANHIRLLSMSRGACEVVNRRPCKALLPAAARPHIGPMAILKIARMGHPVLRQPATLVPDPMAPQIRHLVSDMLDTLADIGGIGLAAPQVHVPLRVVIFEVPGRREESGTSVPMTVLVNPQIE